MIHPHSRVREEDNQNGSRFRHLDQLARTHANLKLTYSRLQCLERLEGANRKLTLTYLSARLPVVFYWRLFAEFRGSAADVRNVPALPTPTGGMTWGYATLTEARREVGLINAKAKRLPD
jgi:hypothetical protein